MTLPEVRLWTALRTRPSGLRFRRQHPVGAYILDFHSPQGKLAIEVDGIAHDMGSNPERDAARDAWLAAQGLTTLRIRAADVLADLDATVRHILQAVIPLHQPPAGPPPHAAHREEG
ncbi:endonuclease domain-containing protein [Sphingomonas sp. ID0503]|uniref:endonuclease domain-containing protein n=1 Tax=Sphingomonas sp. ID0503 TaxID=3399691 RepID=UPI003AFAC729